MKTPIHLLVTILLILTLGHTAVAQDNLSGSWNCECVLENEDETLQFSSFCNHELKGNQVSVSGRELTITDAYIEMKGSDGSIRLPY